jgi:hypothetical protein
MKAPKTDVARYLDAFPLREFRFCIGATLTDFFENVKAFSSQISVDRYEHP